METSRQKVVIISYIRAIKKMYEGVLICQ